MRAVLFDLDGTVTDPAEGITNSVAYALSAFGITVRDRSELYRFIGPPLRRSFSEYYGLSAADAETAVEYYREYYRPKGIFECSLYDGIEDTFKALCEAGYKLALATAKPEIFAEKIAKHFGLDAYLSCISGASLDSSREDKAEIISIALKALDIKDPSASFMVGDRSYDLEGGAKNGLFTIGALYGYGTEEELSSACAAAKTPYDIAKIILK